MTPSLSLFRGLLPRLDQGVQKPAAHHDADDQHGGTHGLTFPTLLFPSLPPRLTPLHGVAAYRSVS